MPITVQACDASSQEQQLQSGVLQAVGHVLLDGLIAALGTAVGGLVALPTLASHSLRLEVAEILMKVGHSLSG